MYPPPKFVLFSSIRVATSCRLSPYCARRCGSTLTWNCLDSPPQVLMSLTPGIVRSWFLTCHS